MTDAAARDATVGRAGESGAGESGAGPSGLGAFVEGERVLLVDRKGRRNLVRLRTGRQYQSHAGVIAHDEIIGREEGCDVEARTRDDTRRQNARYIAIRPTLAEVVLNMPRGAQVIYPKDLGAILMSADIAPGVRVLESGVGSGALSMALLRAGAEVIGYDIRPDFTERAIANVEAMAGQTGRYRVFERDVYTGIEETNLDRVVLDVPEPWHVVVHAEQALRRGGIFCAYLPSINQTAELRAELAHSRFGLAETFELLRRDWHIEGRAVRPDLRMVGHTGFITTARLLGDLRAPGEASAEHDSEPASAEHDSEPDGAPGADGEPEPDAKPEPDGKPLGEELSR